MPIDPKIAKILKDNSIEVDAALLKRYEDFKLVLQQIKPSNIDPKDDRADIFRKLLVQIRENKTAKTNVKISEVEKEFCDLVSENSDTLFSGKYLSEENKVAGEFEIFIEKSLSLETRGQKYEPSLLDPNLTEVFEKLDSGIQAIHVTGTDLLSLRVLEAAFDTSPFLTILAANHNIAKIVTLSFFFTVVHSALCRDGGALFKKIITESLRIVYTKLQSPVRSIQPARLKGFFTYAINTLNPVHMIAANPLLATGLVVGGCAVICYSTGSMDSACDTVTAVMSAKKEAGEKILVDYTADLMKKGLNKAADDTIEAVKLWVKDTVIEPLKEFGTDVSKKLAETGNLDDINPR